MVLVAAQIGLVSPLLVVGFLPGRTEGLQTAEPNHFFEIAEALQTLPQPTVDDDINAGGAAGAPAAAGVEIAAQIESPNHNTGQDFFEKIHIYPDDATDNPLQKQEATIDFGTILAQIDQPYEIYNAFRHVSATLTSIVNNVTPGVETPDVAAPVVVGPQVSILDPTSTFNTDGTTGLGTLVKVDVRALQDGLTSFDDSIDFGFSPGNTVRLFVSGTRVVLLTAEPDLPVVESMAFLTDVIESLDGGEQRLALRKQPREGWRMRYLMTGADRQRLQSILFDFQAGIFGLPMWHEQVLLTTAASGGATTFATLGASDVDFRVGGLAVVFQDAFTFDVLTIVSVTNTLITAESGSQFAYSVGALIMPVRLARITKAPAGRRFPVTLEEFQIEFEATDNDTGAPAGSTTFNPNTYLSRTLMDDCNVVGQTGEQFLQRIIAIDNATGLVTQSSPWDRHKRTSQKGFIANSRVEIQNLKEFLRQFRGRQKAFYLPTFIEDLEVKAAIGIGTALLDITNIGYTRFIQSRESKATFRITFTDDTSLVRVVQSSVVVDASTERLTLDTTWPANRTVAEVVRVQFYELVRFDTDSFTITYPRVGQALLQAPVRVLFDDD